MKKTQIDKLAEYIMFHVPGEPSRSQSAIDTAIRLLKNRERDIKRAVNDTYRRIAYEVSLNPQTLKNWVKRRIKENIEEA